MSNSVEDNNFESGLIEALQTLPKGIVDLFSALNIILATFAFLGNILVIIALCRVLSIAPSTKLFFRCLAVSDLCVGIIVQPIYIYATIVMSSGKTVTFFKVGGVLSAVLCGVSVMTSTAVSVDRLLALHLGIRYRHVVSSKRVRLVIVSFWASSILSAPLWVWKRDIAFKQASVAILVCFVASIVSYAKIQSKLRKHQGQIENHVTGTKPSGEGNSFNVAKYKKTVSSIVWVQLTLVFCYLPFGVVSGIGINNGVDWLAAITLLYFNSSLNPILYCWRIRQVRHAVKDIFKQMYCC